MSNQKKERRKAVAKVTSLQTKTKTSPAHPGGRERGTVWTAREELRRRALAGDGEESCTFLTAVGGRGDRVAEISERVLGKGAGHVGRGFIPGEE